MLPFISVIIPVYNAEKYLSQCLDSVCGQTLRDIEIICVDDGSDDGSAEILRAYAEKDDRITVVTQTNAGAGAARNRGIREARGEYLAFIDSDDFWRPELLERIGDQVKKSRADIGLYPNAVYDERSDHSSTVQFAGWLPSKQPFAPAEYADRLFQMTTPAPGYRLYRREFVRNCGLTFLPQHIAEDIYFVFLSMAFAEKICYIRDVYAFLRRGMDTNLSSAVWKYPRETHYSLLQIRSRLEEAGLYETFRKTFRTAAISSSEYIFWHVPTDILPEDERLRMLAELNISDKPGIIEYHSGEPAGGSFPGKIKTIQRMVDIYGVGYTLRYFLQKFRS